MSLPINSNWPLCKIDAIDPFPFHGLQYRVANQQWIDPMDGRPPFRKPSEPSASELDYYSAYLDGCLWDIGRADPPESEQIENSGGRAAGKKIVSPDGVSPCRLDGRTYQLNISSFFEDGLLLLYWTRKGYPGYKIFAEIDPAIFGIVWANAVSEGGADASSIVPAPSYGASTLDKSADGRRRLIGVSLS